MFLLKDYINEVFLRAENIFESQFLSGFCTDPRSCAVL